MNMLTGKSRPTIEGAGVRLWRAFGSEEVPRFDPFLLLDHFGSDRPEDYLAGFPWHPHRGIETVTYIHRGAVRHGDSLGNSGEIGDGDVQWMTAGGGIIHQEMPVRTEGSTRGFQLWVNLPSSRKMMEPRYREVPAATIPSVSPSTGVEVKVVSGAEGGATGPVRDLVVPVEYLDITLEPGASWKRAIGPRRNSLAYVYSGLVSIGDEPCGEGTVAHLDRAQEIDLKAEKAGARLLFISGEPLGEPVAWGGPIVMNTRAELERAFNELEKGTFIKGANTKDPSGQGIKPRFYRD